MIDLKKDRKIVNNETNIKTQRNFNDLKEPRRNVTTYNTSNFFLILNTHIFNNLQRTLLI